MFFEAYNNIQLDQNNSGFRAAYRANGVDLSLNMTLSAPFSYNSLCINIEIGSETVKRVTYDANAITFYWFRSNGELGDYIMFSNI